MNEKFDILKCNICGQIIQILEPNLGDLVCCNEPMELLRANLEEKDKLLAEKHIPLIEENGDKRYITLKNHPMSNEHYIQLIEAYTKDKKELHIKFLEPNEVAEFDISYLNSDIEMQELCNIHGLWRNTND